MLLLLCIVIIIFIIAIEVKWGRISQRTHRECTISTCAQTHLLIFTCIIDNTLLLFPLFLYPKSFNFINILTHSRLILLIYLLFLILPSFFTQLYEYLTHISFFLLLLCRRCESAHVSYDEMEIRKKVNNICIYT